MQNVVSQLLPLSRLILIRIKSSTWFSGLWSLGPSCSGALVICLACLSLRPTLLTILITCSKYSFISISFLKLFLNKSIILEPLAYIYIYIYIYCIWEKFQGKNFWGFHDILSCMKVLPWHFSRDCMWLTSHQSSCGNVTTNNWWW